MSGITTSVAGAYPEDRARIVQRSHDGADAVPVSRCHEFGGLSAGEPAHRYRRAGRDDGIDVDHRIELDLRARFDAGAVEHHGAGRDPRAALDHAAGEVSVRANQDVVADAGLLARHAPDDRVLHDHAVAPDLHRATLGGDHGAEQHPAVRADGDITGQHRRRRDVSRLRYLRGLQPVLHEHRTTPYHWLGNRIFVRTHIHHPMQFSANMPGHGAHPVRRPLAPTPSLSVSERPWAGLLSSSRYPSR